MCPSSTGNTPCVIEYFNLLVAFNQLTKEKLINIFFARLKLRCIVISLIR